ncbi:hypothetical protein SAMN05892877_1462 [Rhizobium subbaraonis]|uniref:Uncharacterized protein n=1 Tax=Rhizobium subbaraonis TaxID=908946 RepID=A0A285V266_9HYPH|nr:hypothetical protein SAMN05892877_1462 [Rhizobium subbaraonis]
MRALVLRQVGYNEEIILDKRVGADGTVEIGLAGLKPDPRLEPLAVSSNEADEGDRRFTEQAGKGDNVIKTLLCKRVEDVVTGEGCKARASVV